MNDCGWLSDRMPSVALGRAEWSTDEVRHLSGCRSCQEEWELVRVSSRLGQEVGAGLDAGATTSAVLQRLGRTRQENRLRRQAWSFAAVATAAAIAAAVWIGRPNGGPPAPSTAVVAGALQIPLPELDNLEPAELNTLLQTIDEPLVGGSTDAPGPGDPNDDDLEGVFDTWRVDA
jgi:hypothetical protein